MIKPTYACEMISGQFYNTFNKPGEIFEFRGLNSDGDAICHPPNEPSMQDCWVIDKLAIVHKTPTPLTSKVLTGFIPPIESKQMWEILVPTVSNEGKPFRTRYHRVWDKKVYEITGGLTVMQPSKGTWVSPDKTLFQERMIPVRIISTRKQIEEIVSMTMKYYDQLAVLAYKISDEVILKELHRGK